MTGGQVYNIMGEAAKFLLAESEGDIVLDSDFSCGSGKMIESKLYGRQFIIGTKGLEGSRMPLPNHKAMLPVVALFHEVCGHGGQLKYEFAKNTDLSRVLALNRYACYSSSLYYDGNARPGEFTRRYARQPHEIAAQYMGLKAAQAYLPRALKNIPSLSSRIFGRRETDEELAKRADGMLLDYVNYRVSIGSEFIHRKKPYENMSEVFNDFECKFLECYDAHRDYDPDEDVYSPIWHQRKLHDELAEKGICGCGLSEAQAALAGKAASGVHQDIMLCAAFAANDPGEAWKLEKPVFDGFCFSLGDAFRATPPWRPAEAGPSPMERMKNMVREIDARGPPAVHGLDGPEP